MAKTGIRKSRCQFWEKGCPSSFLYKDKAEHEENCKYRRYCCLMGGNRCQWVGPRPLVIPHFTSAHEVNTVHGEKIIFLCTEIHMPDSSEWLLVQTCFGHQFVLMLEKLQKHLLDEQFYLSVYFIGSKKEANNFKSKVVLNLDGRCLTREDTPRAFTEGIGAAKSEADCLVFSTSAAKLFEKERNLKFEVTISKRDNSEEVVSTKERMVCPVRPFLMDFS